MTFHWKRLPAAAVLLALAAGTSPAYPPGEEAPPPPKEEAPAPAPAAPRDEKKGPKKYEEVVTAEAVTTPGLFKVHRVGEKVYYEIPPALFGREMLWYTEVSKVPPGVATSGLPLADRLVRWERRNRKVYLRAVSYYKRGGEGQAVRQAVERATLPSVLAGFEVEAEGADNAAVVDVTRLLAADPPDFSAIGAFSRQRPPGNPVLDAGRSYVEEVKSFPENIEARSVLTYGFGPPPLPGQDPGKPPPPRLPDDARSASVLVHHSLVLLPETPMRGRLFDPRVGYFATPFEDYGGAENRVVRRQVISRFRLEKRDPVPVSEPVRPIVFYISREVPEAWRPHIRKGIEDWNEAFEAAGFRGAIVARDAPSREEDPSWDPEDARHSVIRWSAEPIPNATGPHVSDPRSGEILSSHVVFWHDILKLMQGWYFVLCAPLDPRARTLPLPEAVMGDLVRYVAAHEVGHALGLRHNHKASSAYSVAQLRDRAFTEGYGTNASIMSYGRFNYVAQPQDNVTRLVPKIGPYDRFAVEWGYGPLPAAATPEEEVPSLDRKAARQVEEPWLRFGGEDGPAEFDPTVKAENIGDDPVAATALGLENQDRVLDLLVPGTTRLGEDYSILEETYGTVLSIRQRWFSSVAKLVGGVVETRYLGGRGGEPFARVPKERQKEAVRFLLDRAFGPPGKLAGPEILNRIRPAGAVDPVMSQQRALLEDLLSPRRFRLLLDGEALDPGRAYPALEFLGDVQGGVFRELDADVPAIDPYRRSLQRSYLDILGAELLRPAPNRGNTGVSESGDFPPPPSPLPAVRHTDFRPVAREKLDELGKRIDQALPRAKDPMTAAHLRDARREIDRFLRLKIGDVPDF